MEVYIPKQIKYSVKTISVKAAVRYPGDSDFIEFKTDDTGNKYKNYISDDEENPKMPFIEVGYDKYRNKEFYWHPTIDIENGIILNWPKGINAYISYKVCDEFECKVYDENDNEVLHYEGYVPEFMSIEEEGYGDYINMIIDENGRIKNWLFNGASMREIYNE